MGPVLLNVSSESGRATDAGISWMPGLPALDVRNQ